MRLILLIFFLMASLVTLTNGQDHRINFIIQVNENLIENQLSNLYLSLDDEKLEVNYLPGELVISDENYDLINSGDIKSFYLHFDYNTYSGQKHSIVNFFVELTSETLKQPYVILNCYDFRDKLYKRRYQHLTSEDFICELVYPGSGRLIRKK